ncbi:PQQ-dependent sugar dehydrogenase [Sphingorhabdus lacus]|uniref:PQQ-dependent sugar dehydrogenase n=1 Tax=Sphingorhabdus lacus TaxID=392610 RepID=A0A6I6LCI1_9SPHN|nr:PQQ-dependent sugar dehydrogenase [Sphingorhabdus lacus]QGY80003.1 PQQ-dependent sugar dehydrogenase [Sphingorhabdus lacus]
MKKIPLLLCTSFLAAACQPSVSDAAPTSSGDKPFETTVVADFDEPWAMTFIPGTPYALVTEKKGKLKLWENEGAVVDVEGVPTVAYGGQGGLGDVILHPDFANNGYVYLSYAEAGEGGFGAAVARGKLDLKAAKPALTDVQVIWRQEPKVSGQGHYGHRMAFGPDGMLYISSGERQKFQPAQDLNQNLGKIVRLTDGGMVPSDNPFYDQGRIKSQIWSYGHRNPLGIAFDAQGRLWNQEMGPEGGDELNLVKKAANYGYPKVSNGRNYGAATDDLPDHAPGDGFEAPKVFWNPAISPGGLMIYSGDLFKDWKGSAFIGGLGAKALVRVKLDGESATKADQWDMGARIREVEQGPDGAIWVLEDQRAGSEGRLLKLTPKK